MLPPGSLAFLGSISTPGLGGMFEDVKCVYCSTILSAETV